MTYREDFHDYLRDLRDMLGITVDNTVHIPGDVFVLPDMADLQQVKIAPPTMSDLQEDYRV